MIFEFTYHFNYCLVFRAEANTWLWQKTEIRTSKKIYLSIYRHIASNPLNGISMNPSENNKYSKNNYSVIQNLFSEL